MEPILYGMREINASPPEPTKKIGPQHLYLFDFTRSHPLSPVFGSRTSVYFVVAVRTQIRTTLCAEPSELRNMPTFAKIVLGILSGFLFKS